MIGPTAFDAVGRYLGMIECPIGSALGATIAAELPDHTEWLVPTIVQLELARWLAREAGADKADRVIAFTCVVADLGTVNALSAADLCARHRLATADAVIYGTALAYRADLLTCDRHFGAFGRSAGLPQDGWLKEPMVVEWAR